MPGLEVQDGMHTLAYDNVFEDNNVPNWGVEGTAVAQVPYGIGVMIMASDYNEIRDNEITDNDSVGVVLFGYHDFLFDPVDDPSFDILAEGNYIHNNTFINNGTNPDPNVLAISGNPDVPIPEISWDGCVDDSKDNTDGRLDTCVFENGDARFLNQAICGGEINQDIEAATCQHPELPDLPPGY
ncbi:MAG: right-handed parallel beta-helix repeat-containing protein [Nannocystaceae bacterium]